MRQEQHEQRVTALYCEYRKWFDTNVIRLGAYELGCMPGWFVIIQELLAQIRDALSSDIQKSLRIRQIKEIFGTLRFYYKGQDTYLDFMDAGASTMLVVNPENSYREIDPLIANAIGKSAVICMYCSEAWLIRTDG